MTEQLSEPPLSSEQCELLPLEELKKKSLIQLKKFKIFEKHKQHYKKIMDPNIESSRRHLLVAKRTIHTGLQLTI